MLNIDNDNIMSRGKATKPHGEFWAYQKNGNYDCLDAASAAHLYGHPIASGEAFTDTPYDCSWDELLRIANIAYCRGINEFSVCASSYQPRLDRKYDDSQSSHPYVFHRMNPEWRNVGPFWEYQARCFGMLRQGKPVVDLCIYAGEDMPTKTFAYKLPVIPERYNFDTLNYDALVNRLSADNGEIIVDGGMNYKALIVEDRIYISPEAEKKIRELADNGVTVIRCDKGEDVGERLSKAGIVPDISVKSEDLPNDKTLFFHRSMPGGDIYFIYNHSGHEVSQPLSFRTPFAKAEIWDPKTVKKTSAKTDSDNRISLTLSPYQSLFIVTEK